MAENAGVQQYECNPLVDLLGQDGQTVGIANVIIKYRRKGGPNESEKWKASGWWFLGIVKGELKPEDTWETFINRTGQVQKDLGVQKTGQSVSLTVPLMSITPFAKNLMKGSPYELTVNKTTEPGTRTMTITISTAFVASNEFDFDFSSTNINTCVVTPTLVNSVYSTTSNDMFDDIITQIEANPGVNAAETGHATEIITIVMNPGYILTVDTAPTVTGGVVPTVTPVETDTSIVSTTVLASNGAIDNLSLGVTDASKFKKDMQVCLPTGDASTIGLENEYPYLRKVDTVNNVLYFRQALANLPLDGVEIFCVADIDYQSGGCQLPDTIELRMEELDHSDKSVDLIHFPNSRLNDKDGPFRGTEGEEGSLTFICLGDRVLQDDGSYNYQPYETKTVNSIHGDY